MDKKTLKLAIILIILIALAYFYQGPFKDWKSDLGKPDNFLAKIDASQIDKIEIIKNGETAVLIKENDKWKIAGTKDFYVEENLADSLNKALGEAISADVELVSSNKDKKSEFKTNLEQGVGVKLFQNEENEIANFVIGKTGNDFSTYVSESNLDETYKIKINLSGLFSRDSWYDKNIFLSDKEKISKIRFQYPDREFIITKTQKHENTETLETEKLEYEWEGISPYEFSVDENKIDEILNIMSNLIAAKIPEQTFDGTGLEKNLIIAQATGEGIDNILMVGGALQNGSTALRDYGANAEEELYYAKKGDSDNIYLITKEQRDELDKNIKDLE
ncbi:DUF4340 domain-containing protein [Candidatus Parcubacteria bacterium]|nr:DUF4340 domain-containing protein [Candidatus Parcubacteria bacterium]